MSKVFRIKIFAFTMLIFFACKSEKDSCKGVLFGSPTPNTGLTNSVCKPICECKNYTSKIFSLPELNALKEWELSEPFEELTFNPYRRPVPENEPCLCAVIIEDLGVKKYHLKTFNDEKSAEEAGGIITHYDACGLCSTLQDLAVYAENLDIGKDVKECGLKNLTAPFRNLVSCIEELGFTKPCAQIWAYNVRNTQEKCIQYCLSNEKYNQSDGTLSPCLECDEVKSGPVFKHVAGRTRRNTGIANAICRSCDELQPVKHDYPF